MANQVEENKAVARKFFALINDGKIDEAVGMFGKDGTYWLAGMDGEGMTRTVPEVAEMFRGAFKGPAKGVQFAERGILAEGDRVQIEAICTGKINDRNPYNQRYCFIFEIKDGEIVGGHEYMDTAHSARAFAAE